jgi:hypothetical protein
MKSRCPSCGAELSPARAYCLRCGWRQELPLDAIVIDVDSPAGREQGLDTLYIGIGLFVLGVLVFAGGLVALLPQLEGNVLEIDFQSFLIVLAIVTGLTLALFIASAVVFAARKGSGAARAGGITVSVIGSVVVSTVVAVIVVAVVIVASIAAMFAALADACNCQPNPGPPNPGPPPAASTFIDHEE